MHLHSIVCVQTHNGYDFFLLFCLFFLFYVYLRNIHSAVGIIAYISSQQLLFAPNCSKNNDFLIKHMAALFGKKSAVI